MPYWVVTLTLPTVLAPQYGIWAPVWVAMVTAVAACLGQFMTFMIGYGGRSFSEKLSRRFSPEAYDTVGELDEESRFMGSLFHDINPEPDSSADDHYHRAFKISAATNFYFFRFLVSAYGVYSWLSQGITESI